MRKLPPGIRDNRLWVRRAERRISQSALAAKARMSFTHYRGIEVGEYMPTEGELRRLARALHCEVSALGFGVVQTAVEVAS